MEPSSIADIPSSVTLLTTVLGVVLIVMSVSMILGLRYYVESSFKANRSSLVVAGVVCIILLTILLATFQTLGQAALLFLFVAFTLGSAVPLIIVWRLSTISVTKDPPYDTR